MKKFHFVSSLPRSGSTLLCNILAQNPKFHASHTSGCLDILFIVRNQWDNLVEHKAHPLPEAKQNVLRAMLNAYYQHVEAKVVFDKSRGWLANLEMIEEILGRKAKVLVCIRDIPNILASLEKLNRNTSKVQQPPGEAQNYFQFQSQVGRCEHWLRNDNLLGLACNRVIDAVQRGFRDRLHFIKFDKLTTMPYEVMNEVYDFLEEPYFKHDFDHIEQVTNEDDTIHGYVNLHQIKPQVENLPNDAITVLGEPLVKRYSELNLDKILRI
jgi:sulfotransferase